MDDFESIGDAAKRVVDNVIKFPAKHKEMTLRDAVDILKHNNLWRRDNDDKYEMPDPTELGKAIDVIIEYFEEDTCT